MNAQPDAGTTSYCATTRVASEDSDEETSQEEPPVTNWSELSIIERVGLNSEEMSEQDVETAFSQITLAFRCDQYTLKQRLQAEEHARNLAEENVQLELTRGRETLEALKGLCLDSKRSKVLQRLELSLDILGGTVERISNTAEVLGAVHQEARVSRAVDLMVAHVENLRRRHDRSAAELEEARRVIQQQNSCRGTGDPRASPDPDDSDSRLKSYLQNNNRRRVSISVIPSKPQEKTKQEQKKRHSHRGRKPVRSTSLSSESSCSVLLKEDNNQADERPPDPGETPEQAPCAPPPTQPAAPPPPPEPEPEPECLSTKQPSLPKMQDKNSPPHVLRQRHRGRSALSKKKADKENKKDTNLYRRLSAAKCGPQGKQRPLAQWLHRCHWALFFVYLVVLFCFMTFSLFLLEAA